MTVNLEGMTLDRSFKDIVRRGQKAARAAVGGDMDQALVTACMLGDVSQARVFLDMGADANAEDGHALFTSAMGGNADIVLALMGAGVHTQGKAWFLAKDTASKLGHTGVVTVMTRAIAS